MANIRKQFNFRNGVQVDDDNLVVSPTGLVGIGTTIPTESLDVRGNVKISGFATAAQFSTQDLTAVTATIQNLNLATAITGSGVSVGGGIITATSASGIVTYYGDGRYLDGLPTSQWLDIDAGLGYTSIYAQGNVGVGTNDPRFTFQVGGNPDGTLSGFARGVGIGSEGDILITGIATARSFVGFGSDITEINASNLSTGTVNLDRLPNGIPDYKLNPSLNLGIVTTTRIISSIGNITTLSVANTIAGVANTALGLSGVPDITVGVLTATAVAASSFIGGITGDVTGNLTGTATTAASLTSDANVDIQDLTVGVATATTLIVNGNVGIGTSVSTKDIHIQRSGANAQIQLQSDIESIVALGSSESINGYNGVIKYGNISGLFPYSDNYSLDFINYGNGSINYYLEASGNIGLNTGNFYWHRASDRLMTLTNQGNLGIGITQPSARLEVAGLTSTADLFVANDVTLSSNLFVNNDLSVTAAGSSTSVATLYITGGRTNLLDGEGNVLVPVENNTNFNIASGISTANELDLFGKLHVDSDFAAGGGILVAVGATDERPLAPIQVGLSTDDSVIVIGNGGQIGIGTTAVPGTVSLDCSEGVATFNRIGIGTRTVTTGAAIQAHGPIVILESNDPEAPGTPGVEAVGVGTFSGGVSTGVGDGVIKMSVAGNQLTINVLGVGSTTLTLS